MNNLKVKLESKDLKKNGGSKKPGKKLKKPEKEASLEEPQKGPFRRRIPRPEKYDYANKTLPAEKKKKSKFRKYLKRIVLLVFIAGVCAGGYFAYTRWERLQKFNNSITANSPQAQVCDNILDPKCWSEAFSPKLEQENGITGMMIVGLDTRDEGGVNQGLKNTDSIIVALYNHDTKKTSLISFPRDLRIPYYINGNGPYYEKINAIYATGEQRDDVEDGFDLLEENLERILDVQIQYRTIIKLKGVEDAVDAVNGVEIDVPTYLKVQYPNDYPGQDGKPNSQYLYYEFQPGKQTMDGEHALVWARFRMVVGGDANYASDFSRARRQQEVIDALKTKVLEDEEESTLKKAEKYWDLFQTFNKNVDVNIGLEEVFAAFTLMDEADTNPINLVLDPNFGGLNQIVYHPPTSETGGYIIRFKDETFATLRNYLDLIWSNPKLYDEDAQILIENHLGRSYLDTDKAIEFRNDIYNSELPITSDNLTMITSSQGEATGVIIVDMTGGEMSGTTQYLAEYFGAAKIVEDPVNYGYTQSGYEEDIKVIVNPPLE